LEDGEKAGAGESFLSPGRQYSNVVDGPIIRRFGRENVKYRRETVD
jgi:hypothetical protein